MLLSGMKITHITTTTSIALAALFFVVDRLINIICIVVFVIVELGGFDPFFKCEYINSGKVSDDIAIACLVRMQNTTETYPLRKQMNALKR